MLDKTVPKKQSQFLQPDCDQVRGNRASAIRLSSSLVIFSPQHKRVFLDSLPDLDVEKNKRTDVGSFIATAVTDLRYPFFAPCAHFLLCLFGEQEGNKLVGMSGNIDMNQSTSNLSLVLLLCWHYNPFVNVDFWTNWTTSHPPNFEQDRNVLTN